MTTLLWILAMIVTIGAFAYLRVSLLTATLGTAIVLAIGTGAASVSPLLWVVFLVIALPLNISSFRQNVITRPLLKMYRGIMPEMSSTEKEAIEAGTTWWEADLFAGKPDWRKLHNYPKASLSAEEQAFLDGPVEEVCRMLNQHQVSHELGDLPEEIWQYLKDHGFFAMIIKKKYGGLEYSAYAQSRVLQKLAGLSSELASTVGVPNSLGPGELLQHYGTT
ncbi:acyl-CoA dehydrogenase family protein, partial [Shewanella sp. 0m-11]